MHDRRDSTMQEDAPWPADNPVSVRLASTRSGYEAEGRTNDGIVWFVRVNVNLNDRPHDTVRCVVSVDNHYLVDNMVLRLPLPPDVDPHTEEAEDYLWQKAESLCGLLVRNIVGDLRQFRSSGA